MRKIELRRTRILKRVLNSSVATSIAKAFRSISSATRGDSDLQGHFGSFAVPYTHYDEQKRVRIQLLELEQKKAEAVDLARRPYK